mgnify:CR=1 FL=1
MIKAVYTVKLSRSNWMLAYLISLHLLMLLTLLSLSLPTILAAIATISMVGSFLYYCRQQQWLIGRNSITSNITTETPC